MLINDSKGKCENYTYDKAGNRTKKVCNGMEELYRYDKRNRLTAYTKGGVNTEFEYDNAGNLLKDDKARYEYDAFNRNIKVETFSGDIQINRYDGEGLRHEMEENGKLFTFIFRGTEIVAEESKEDKIRYIRTGELLASDAESARTYYHYASDEMGSITHVVAGEGQVLNRYEYDAWGNLTTCEEKIKNRFKYNGQQYDQISGQYYLRARYYNPVIGRFVQEDTYRGDGLNLYAYCKNNPVYYVNPSGNIYETAVNRIMDKFGKNGECGASRNEQKKLAAYLRDKDRKGGNLSDNERRILNQIDEYTYLSRYDNQTMPSHLTNGGNSMSNNSGIVEFKAPLNATSEQIQQVKVYVDGCNEALQAGALSPSGRVSTKGKLRQQASSAAKNERKRAEQAGNPYKGQASHVPDTTWTGTPQPYSWLDLDPVVNTSLGGQSPKYPVGYKPTEFVFKEEE